MKDRLEVGRNDKPRARAAAVSRRRLLLLPAAALASVAAAPWTHGKEPRRLLVLGDSLSAEYGLRRGAGWVALLEGRLKAQRLEWQVVNASISGETTAGGLARLPALLAKHAPRAVVIELGGNDALRGLSLDATRENLRRMARLSREAGARVLIAGMQIPPNYGRAYAERFSSMFADVAREQQAALVPFLLAGVAERDELFQPDRIHPTAEAQSTMLDNVWPVLAPMLKAVSG